MGKISILIFFLSLTSLAQKSPPPPKDGPPKIDIEVVLGIDKTQKLEFTPSPKIQVGNEAILSYILIPQKREIVFRGLKVGTTSVTVRDGLGDIKVVFQVNITATDQSKVVLKLKEFLGDIEGIEIGIKGDDIYIGGNIVVPNDMGRIAIILEKYKEVINLVELSAQTQRVIAKKMQEEIQQHGVDYKDVTVRVVNGNFWLEGVVSSDAAKEQAGKIAIAYLPDKIESLSKRTETVASVKRDPLENFIIVNKKSKPSPIPKLIKVTAQFVELTKDFNRIFGFKWEPLLSQGQGSISFGRTSEDGVTTKSNDTLVGTISNLFPKLSSAKAAGYARVIQSGVIVVKNKGKASINKKEVTPFAIGSGEFTKSEKAEAGFNLEITPTILQKERIDLNIGLSVSAVIGSGTPRTLTNNVKTNFVVKSKSSAVAGGIVVNKSSNEFDKNPPGGVQETEGGSPLFSFVRSKSHTQSRSQFVVFVTPEIIASAASGTEEIKRKFRRRSR